MRHSRLLFTVFLVAVVLTAAGQAKEPETWHGFRRVNFKIDTISAYIVVPEKPVAGNPWMWRSFSPEFHTDIDSILVTRGFYLAFLNVDSKQLYGQPALMERWEKFYHYLVKEKHLAAKAALSGAVRGTLCEFAWAKLHPDRVSSIYCENPVADIKNWPGSKGSGTGGSPDQWKQLLAAYGMTEAQALQYGDSPKDNLASLATAKIPLYFSFGLHDGMIPMEENALVIANAYIRLGGPITVHPMTIGRQEANGHHVPIENPAEIAEFMYSNSVKQFQR